VNAGTGAGTGGQYQYSIGKYYLFLLVAQHASEAGGLPAQVAGTLVLRLKVGAIFGKVPRSFMVTYAGKLLSILSQDDDFLSKNGVSLFVFS
jgi:hypothetical protein